MKKEELNLTFEEKKAIGGCDKDRGRPKESREIRNEIKGGKRVKGKEFRLDECKSDLNNYRKLHFLISSVVLHFFNICPSFMYFPYFVGFITFNPCICVYYYFIYSK